MKITIADSAGKIVRNVECPANMASIQSQPGEFCIEGHFSEETHFVDTRLMVAVEKQAKPAGYYQFDIPTRNWVPIQHTTAELIATAIVKRSQLLMQSDWTQLPDVPLATKTAWAAYRQALRDITLQAGYPQVISWPIQPI